MKSQLSERSVLMKFSAGLPGQSRKDKRTTEEVKSSKGLGANAGKWIADLYPEGALDPIKEKLNEARAYHDKVTFPFGASPDDDSGAKAIAGIGILPAGMMLDYGDNMRRFKGELEVVTEEFLADPRKYVDWAVAEHNGTFDPKNYPGCSRDAAGVVQFDAEVFRTTMRKRIYLRADALPVPQAEQFTESIRGLLSTMGVDPESVDLRVRDSQIEAQRELLARMKDPVLHMAAKLSGQTCHCRSCKGRASKTANFKDSLVQNIQEVAALVPKMNLGGDPDLDAFAAEMNKLGSLDPEVLRVDDSAKSAAAEQAAAVLKRLEGYKL